MINLFIDTTALREAGDAFGNGDFQKILRHARNREVKLFISQIVLEERRTQLVRTAIDQVEKLNLAIKNIATSYNILFQHIPAPTPSSIDVEDIKKASRKVIQDIVNDNLIEVVPFTFDHANKTFEGYFEVGPPFNPQEKDREKNRKHIPDSWIFHAALEIYSSHSDLVILSGDNNLRACLEREGLRAVRSFGGAIELIETCIGLTATSTSVVEPNPTPLETDQLTTILGQMSLPFQEIETRLLGYIAYMDGSNKSEIVELLIRHGASPALIDNAAQRLVLSGLIEDTGNHYILKDRHAGQLAMAKVEGEIISLMGL